jgi:hypothetical protein
MLAKTPRFTCVECAATDASPHFQWHYDRPGNGPAYWSDQGPLCSASCALAHFRKRESRGEVPQTPAAAPFKER